MKRKTTRQISLGNLKIGGNAPISIQSMINVDSKDTPAVIKQAKLLEQAGCEIVRVSVKDMDSAKTIHSIKGHISMPLEADIHFDYRLALLAVQSGADCIRLNPGNISKPAHIKKVLTECKTRGIPVRIGINSGSLDTRYISYAKKYSQSDAMVKCALDYVQIFKKHGFVDLMLSLKSSDTLTTIEAYRKISRMCDFPLHLGVTATGSGPEAIVKSAIGIGALLSEGIGDTIRVSLTADPREEVMVARHILQALGIRIFAHDIISCPTCGRCQVDLESIVKQVKRQLSSTKNNLSAQKIAIMGCEVNGPGEAKDADIGIAFGKNSGILFKKGKVVRKVKARHAVTELLCELKNN